MTAEVGHRLLAFLRELHAMEVAESRWQLSGSIWGVVQGHFISSGSAHADLAAARAGGDFVPVA